MATQLATAKRQLRVTKAELARQLADMQRLHELSLRLSSHAELSTLLQEVLEAVCALQQAPMGVLLLYSADRRELQVAARVGVDEAFARRLGRLPAGTGACGSAVAERRPVIVGDVDAAACPAGDRELAKSGGYQALCCVPLQARTGQMVGAIATYFRESHAPSERELELVALYGGQASEFIENARHYEEVRDSSRLKDEFLATLSHEIRTPLNAVLGWARLLRTTTPPAGDDRNTRALEAIERNSRIQAQLVEDLLDISRIVTGKLRLRFEPVNLARVVEGALDTVRPAADNRRIELVTSLAPDVTVFGDSDRLQQVVWNLLTNAVRFTPEGGRVSVRVEQAAATAVLTVADTGVGIAPAFLPHVFDRFRQGDASGANAHRGLGLGLAIVRHLAEAHGGRAEAFSAGRDAGATFTVTLPVGSVAASGDQPEAAAVGATPTLTGTRILVVEDEPDSRDLLATTLETYGARVTAVASGVDALSALNDSDYDALVADIGMADMNGYALIRAIRALADKQGRHLPALALTVYAHSRDHEEAIAAGFDRHISKPIDPQRVAAVVQSLIGEFPR
jgi:signal transduction histidine kinase/ActR/RegA family two-component response regulator